MLMSQKRDYSSKAAAAASRHVLTDAVCGAAARCSSHDGAEPFGAVPHPASGTVLSALSARDVSGHGRRAARPYCLPALRTEAFREPAAVAPGRDVELRAAVGEAVATAMAAEGPPAAPLPSVGVPVGRKPCPMSTRQKRAAPPLSIWQLLMGMWSLPGPYFALGPEAIFRIHTV